MSSPILVVNNVEVIYDHVILVLKGVSLEVPQGSIVALLGANGAGKTTTLKAISNLLASERGEVTKGSIEFKGERVDPDQFVAARRLYYEMAGWDGQTGVPTKAKLAELSVDEAAIRS